MKACKLYLLALLTAASLPAMAESDSNGTGLFLEPGVSYAVTNSNIDYPGAGNSSAATRGFGLVLRAGVHVWDRFFVAADGRYGLPHFEDNAGGISTTASTWDIAPVVGMQVPDSGPRLYIGYVVAGNVNPQSVNGKDLTLDQAQGWRVGAGLMVRHVSVNIEWQRLHYGDARLQNGSQTITGVGYNPEGLVASVTFPIDFN